MLPPTPHTTVCGPSRGMGRTCLKQVSPPLKVTPDILPSLICHLGSRLLRNVIDPWLRNLPEFMLTGLSSGGLVLGGQLRQSQCLCTEAGSGDPSWGPP